MNYIVISGDATVKTPSVKIYAGEQPASAASICYTTTKSVRNGANGTVNLAFVVMTGGTAITKTDDVALLMSKTGSTTVKNDSVGTYTVYINGEKKEGVPVDSTGSTTAGLYTDYSIDDNGVYKIKVSYVGTDKGVWNRAMTSYDGYLTDVSGTISASPLNTDSNTVVYLWRDRQRGRHPQREQGLQRLRLRRL